MYNYVRGGHTSVPYISTKSETNSHFLIHSVQKDYFFNIYLFFSLNIHISKS